MKRVIFSLVSFLFLGPILTAQGVPQPPAASNQPKQPTYFYLYARVTDHVNMDISEARLRRMLPAIERFHKQHPDAHVTATVFVSGASSEALAARNAETGIKDLLLSYQKRGLIEIGYDGTDEPTYEHRPMVHNIETKSYKDRWLERAGEDEKFLTEGRDPLTGDPQPGKVGGLQQMQQIFGKAASITGVSVGQERLNAKENLTMPGAGANPTVTPEVGDWEIVPLLRRYNTEAVLFGLPGSNPAHLPGFGGAIMGIGREMSPVPSASPELFWADNVLRSSESGGLGARVIRGSEGVPALKDFTAKLDRSKLRIIHMEIYNEADYLKPDYAKTPLSPTLTYAYSHPDAPKLPMEFRAESGALSVMLAKEDAALEWLAGQYMEENPGSRFVSNADLRQMTPNSTGFPVPTELLRAALKEQLLLWGNNTYPPSYFKVGDHYLSLAETFQVLTDALAEWNRTGSLPQSLTVAKLYGPVLMATGHGPNVGDVKIASLAKVCSEIDPALHDDSGYPVPKNMVPVALQVDGIGMNAAQFLRLMAQAVVDPKSDSELRVKMTYMFPGTAQLMPKTRAMQDTGATWTFKPAPLQPVLTTQAMR